MPKAPAKDKDKPSKEQCRYSNEDLITTMKEVVRRKGSLGDPAGLTKPAANEIAAVLNPPDDRIAKHGISVKNQFNKQKGLWNEVTKICNNSGFSAWDQKYGANITPDKAAVWTTGIVSNPKSKPFRNAGFLLYEYFDEILPMNVAQSWGRSVFHPSTGKDAVADSDDDSDPPGCPNGSDTHWTIEDPQCPLPDDNNEIPAASQTTQKSKLSTIDLSSSPSSPSPPASIIPAGDPPSTTGCKRGPSETPLPSARTARKSCGGRPDHTPLQTPSTRVNKADERFKALDIHISNTNALLKAALEPPPPPPPPPPNTPTRLSDAVKYVGAVESVWLPNKLAMQFTDLLESSRDVVASYVGTWGDKPEDVLYRRQWILCKLGLLELLPKEYDLSANVKLPLSFTQPMDFGFMRNGY
ncbi:hypothetical protein C8F01DRAFT_1365857 [Mycena amicta]|nr:hypothetical protein C8F01DRAFT_1365857 [Mycena amicta]